MMKTNCFEIYTKNPETNESGWDIINVEVISDTVKEAKEKIKNYPLFDCIITCNDWHHKSEAWPLWNGEETVNRK